jgi:hypothetical protein
MVANVRRVPMGPEITAEESYVLFHRAWHRRSIARGGPRPGLRYLVLIWILLSQFPLPLVHAHTSNVSARASLLEHLSHYHAHPPHHLAHLGLHWHLISPWDTADTHHPSGSESSALGLWGAKVPAIPQAQASLRDCLDHVGFCESVWQPLVPCCSQHAMDPRIQSCPSDFLQTFSGVPWCALVGVALR